MSAKSYSRFAKTNQRHYTLQEEGNYFGDCLRGYVYNTNRTVKALEYALEEAVQIIQDALKLNDEGTKEVLCQQYFELGWKRAEIGENLNEKERTGKQEKSEP